MVTAGAQNGCRAPPHPLKQQLFPVELEDVVPLQEMLCTQPCAHRSDTRYLMCSISFHAASTVLVDFWFCS